MAVMPVYNCFHPILRQKTKKIEDINEDIHKLAQDMIDTMYRADGVGLAANQVGKDLSMLVVDINAGDEHKKGNAIVMINPEIKSYSEEESDYQEGCLSIPLYYEHVLRPKNIQVVYTDLNLKEHSIEADELLSRVTQHEVDHLNGILFFDRISPLKRALAKSKLRRIQKGDVQAHYDMILADGSFIEGIPEDDED